MTTSGAASSRLTMLMRGLLIAASAVLLITGLVTGMPLLRALALPAIVAAVLLPALAGGQPGAWLKLLAVALLAVPVAIWPLVGRLLPALVMALVGGFFAVTLLPGRVPLVERMARAIHATRNESPPAELAGYRRLWTVIWAAWLLGVAAAIAVAALTWNGAMVTVISALAIPVAIFGLMAVEFPIRRWRLGGQPSMSFREFLLAMTALRWEHLRT